jgi:hypothetical protein
MEPSSGSSSEHQHVPVNRYKLLRKKYQQQEIKYDNYNKVHIKLTFRMCVVGSTGSGKTNAVIDIIDEIDAFTKILLFTKVLQEPIYANFIDDIHEAEKETGKQILTVGDNLENLPKVESNSDKDSTLLIIDDMLEEKSTTLAKALPYWTRGRKFGCSAVYLSQSYFKIPLDIRKNSQYFIFTKIGTERDLRLILKDHELGVTDEQIEELYRKAVKDGFPNYFLIDKEVNIGDRYMFRKNLTPLAIPPPHTVSKVKGVPSSQKGIGGKKRPSPAPAKENESGVPRRTVNLLPPPPLAGASPAQIEKYIATLTTRLQDGDITMEDVTTAMEDVPDEVFEAMEEVPWWELDTFTEGSGVRPRPKKKRKIMKRAPAAMSNETIRAIERLLGQRVQPYWK